MSDTLLYNGPTIPDRLAKRLKQARKEARLTQQQVADQIGLLRPNISKMDTADRGVASVELACFAELYGKPMEWFSREARE